MAETILHLTDIPAGCTCERISADTSADAPGTWFVLGRSDPPCKVHLPQVRAVYDAGYERGYVDARRRTPGYDGPEGTEWPRKGDADG